MIKKIMRDFCALEDMFIDLPPEGKEKIRHKVMKMVETEEYSYLKYLLLQKGIEFMTKGDIEEANAVFNSALIADTLTPPVPPEEPRKSHFRPHD